MTDDGYRDPARNFGDQAMDSAELEGIGTAAADLTAELLLMGGAAEDSSAAAGRVLAADGFATGAALADVVHRWTTQERALRDGLQRVAEHLGVSARVGVQLEEAIAEGLRLNSGITGL
ncbi:hypothetical protein [Streptomyces avicenniae]|uniref:hypothetical protein n=1 Tax=Streptomyces avicenniae TaxID=500153 RepID=UPI00069B74C9|nr:hypothetical protein [Streptomyces avicenniae]